MATSTDFNIQHALRGRLRVRFPATIGAKNRLHHLKNALAGNRGIIHVRANPLCGSITIHYDPEITEHQTVLAMLGKFPSNEAPPSNKPAQMTELDNAAGHEPNGIITPKKPFRKLWNLSGAVSVGIGVVGVFLPLVPTVPLFLLAGFCFWRGSPKLYNRLVNSGTLGRMIDDFRKGKGLTARSKLRAILLMWVSLTISALFLVSSLTLRIILVLVGLGVTYHILRIKTFVPQIEKGRLRLTAPK